MLHEKHWFNHFPNSHTNLHDASFTLPCMLHIRAKESTYLNHWTKLCMVTKTKSLVQFLDSLLPPFHPAPPPPLSPLVMCVSTEYHSEGCLLESNLFTKKQSRRTHSSHRNKDPVQDKRSPTTPRVIPLRQNKLLQGKCYREFRLSKSLPNLAAEDRLELSISNAQGLFQKAQQKVRSRRVSRLRRKGLINMTACLIPSLLTIFINISIFTVH